MANTNAIGTTGNDARQAWALYATNTWSDDAMGWDTEELGAWAWAELVAWRTNEIATDEDDTQTTEQVIAYVRDKNDDTITPTMVEWAYEQAIVQNLDGEFSII